MNKLLNSTQLCYTWFLPWNQVTFFADFTPKGFRQNSRHLYGTEYLFIFLWGSVTADELFTLFALAPHPHVPAEGLLARKKYIYILSPK